MPGTEATHAQLAGDVKPPGFAPVTQRALDDIVRRIVSELHPEQIILFGSYGYGSPTEDSDVDLLVVMETSSRPADRYLAVSRLIRPRPFPLDILVKTPDEIARALEKGDFFIREIVTRGQTLYERSALARFTGDLKEVDTISADVLVEKSLKRFHLLAM